MNETQKMGLAVLGIGTLVFLIGILLLLDRSLLIMSNILILMGIIILMTFKGFFQFAIQSDKIQGTIAFFLGIVLVTLKLPVPGIITEVTGAYWLFGGFWPLLLKLLSNVPQLVRLLPFISGKYAENFSNV